MRKKRSRSRSTPQARFLGLDGYWRTFANLGMAGIVAGIAVYLITVALPNAQDRFHDEVRAEREAARVETEKSRQHGNTAAKLLADEIRNQTTTLSDHLTKNRETQMKILEAQLKNNK